MTMNHWFPRPTSETPPPPPPPPQRMTNRDTFAAAALTGLLADDGDRIDHAMPDFTRRAYEWADAMLLQREAWPEINRLCTQRDEARREAVACEPTKPTLTNEERRAIEFAIEYLQPVGNYDNLAQLTLRRLLERLK